MKTAHYIILLLMASSCIGRNKACKNIDERTLSIFAEDQINKGIMAGDTVICGYRLKWTARSRGSSNVEITRVKIPKNTPQPDEPDDCAPLHATNLKKDTISLIDKSYDKTLLIFANNYSCLQCFSAVNEWISESNIDTAKVKIIVLGRVGMETLNKRSLVNQLTPLLSYSKGYFFDMQKEVDAYPPKDIKHGLYGRFQVSKTPALLVIDNKKEKECIFLPYEKAFDGAGIINEASAKLMLKFLTAS